MLSLHKKRRLIIGAVVAALAITPAAVWGVNRVVEANNTYAAMTSNFKDQNFYNCVAKQLGGSDVSDTQLSSITLLTTCSGKNITDVTGLEKMTNLDYLHLGGNQISEIDLTKNTALRVAYIGGNPFSSLDVTKNVNLTQLSVSQTNLTFLDISKNTKLNSLSVDDIFVKANITGVASGSNYIFDLSKLEFLTGKGEVNKNAQTIENTANYTYDSSTNVVTVNNVAGANGYIMVRQYPSGNYKLWIANVLSFDMNGGAGAVASQSCAVGAVSCTVTVPSTIPTRSGWEFKGWAETPDATSAKYSAGSTVTISANKTLYAVWSGGVTLTFDPNYPKGTSGSGYQQECLASPSTSNCEIEIQWSLSSIGSYAPGGNYYKFVGWAETANATSAKYQKGDKLTLSSNKTLYAVWAPAYALVLQPDESRGGAIYSCVISGGSCRVEINDEFNKDYTGNSNFLKDGYVVIGWAETANAATVTYAYHSTITLTGNKTLYAVYGPTYMLKFDGNLATAHISDYSQQKRCLTSGQACDLEVKTDVWAERDDPYIFKGWSESKGVTSAQYQKGDTVRVDKSKTLYAVWAPAYVLKYDCNGKNCWTVGAGSGKNQKCEVVNSQCVIELNSYAYLTNGDNSGDTFIGWADTPNATTPQYQQYNTLTLTSNKTLYALWGKRYKVIFNVNDGSGLTEELTCAYTSDKCTVGYRIKTRSGYKFLGWSRSADSSSAEYKYEDGNIAVTESTTLYAVWERDPAYAHMLSLNLNEATGDLENQICVASVRNGECEVIISQNEPSRDGYYFLGYADAADAAEAKYAVSDKITLSADKTIYAIWAPIYTLSFDVNNGNGNTEVQTCHSVTTTTASCEVTIPSTKPSRSGYHFLGWTGASGAISAQYAPGDTVALSADKTLYAVWAPVYTLGFNANGGSGVPATQTCHSITTTTAACPVSVPDVTPVKEGYHFLGYADTADATTAQYVVNDVIVMNGNKTIYAIWSPIYTLKLDLNKGEEEIKDELEDDTETTDTKEAEDEINDEDEIIDSEEPEPLTCYAEDITETCSVTIYEDRLIRKGYEFFGYAFEADAKNPYYLAGDEFTFEFGEYEATLYTVWADGILEWVQARDYIVGSSTNMMLKINYPLVSFEKLLVDGSEVAENNYALTEGSTVITVRASYLDILNDGIHVLTAQFDGGVEANTTFTITRLPVPNTGIATSDGQNGGLDALMYILPAGVVTMLGVGGYIYKTRKAHRKFGW